MVQIMSDKSDKTKTLEENLVNRLLTTFPYKSSSNEHIIKESLKGFFSNKMAIIIDVGMVIDIGKRNDMNVTPKEAIEILKILQEEFDIVNGISYDIIRNKILQFKGLNKKEEIVMVIKKESSTDKLRNFLTKEYIEVGGADTMGTAIRDCLTDLIHINEKLSLRKKMKDILRDATEVYEEEKLTN